MIVYKYVGKDLQGHRKSGLLKANNLEELIVLLKESGYFLLAFKEHKARKTIKIFKGKMNFEVISLFCNQLKMTIGAGITILQSLDILNFQCKNQLLKENINLVIGEIHKGESLYRSLEKCTNKFPKFFSDMIKVGEESGRLEEALNQLSDYYYKEFKLQKKIKAAMAYPILVSIITVIAVLFILIKVIPSFTSVLLSLNSEIPFMTKVVIGISDFTKDNIIGIFSGISFVLIIGKVLFRYKKISLRDSKILMMIPLVGNTYKMILEMKLCKVLFMLLSSGVHIMKSLEICSETTNNKYLSAKLRDVILDIGKGYSFSEAMQNTLFFSEFMLGFIKIGEETGKLEIMIDKLSIIYEENIESDMSKLTDYIQPIMILFVGAIIGFLIVAAIMPIFSIANAV
jgi:type IV pilus assembly protein PilC